MKPRLLVVDDDEEIQTQLKWALAEEYDVQLAGERASALAAFREQEPAVVLLDLGLPPSPDQPVEGMAALSEILARDRLAKVIIISGRSERQHILAAIGTGAYDFVRKPIDVEVLKVLLRRAFHLATIEREYHQMQEHLQGEDFEAMLGTSAAMQQVFASIRKVAETDAAVLVLGESGTGKERVAQAIHRRSARRGGPFVAINCGAIPAALLESELFGHEKGAFTDAHAQRKGRVEAAAGGTLFLDEIGEVSPPLQVKLLRFLQEQRIQRVGGREEIPVETRVIAATNVDLKQAMQTGKFREDLFYRLAVVVVRLPPLREREEDILLLAKAFLRRSAAGVHRPGLAFDREAITAINRHSWPGNVRELENRVRQAVIMAEGKQITTADLELNRANGGARFPTLKEARDALDREMLQRALRMHRGKVSPAAALLGITRPTFYDLMDKLGLNAPNRESVSRME